MVVVMVVSVNSDGYDRKREEIRWIKTPVIGRVIGHVNRRIDIFYDGSRFNHHNE
jgi:hypothetical protein